MAGIFICWIALFAPGIVLIYGIMPWWGQFRNYQVYRRCALETHSCSGCIQTSICPSGIDVWKEELLDNDCSEASRVL